MPSLKAEIGIFGGSGFYQLLSRARQIEINTPFGKPSGKITLGNYQGKKVAFLPRHGEKHEFPPHKIPYRANLWAFKKLGVKQIIAPCASGSLTSKIKPGDFVICDQFVDRTWGRNDTFFDGPKVVHPPMADPYCPSLKKIAIKTCEALQIPHHNEGTIVVIQGPRFSTRSESKWFQSQGFEVINMTAYPEVALARELAMCYINIALITDYDTGLEGYQNISPVTATEVIKVFQQNIQKVKKIIFKMVENLPKYRTCPCPHLLENALI
ncbi:MAG: S-methyl-5'-thioadenosine phosphorylase [Candidatus Doudnabacteria bacterium]